MTIDEAKVRHQGDPDYLLSNATVYRSDEGFTFSKYLDTETDSQPLSEAEREALSAYLETQLHHNKGRFQWQVDLLQEMLEPQGKKVLDIGSGGGAFLSVAKAAGFGVEGLELDLNRAEYARAKCGCDIHTVPVADETFLADHAAAYDAVTLWDVIEHVNFPFQTLESIRHILKQDGFLLIDTPAKDTFYHRFGELTYKLTFGKFPTFLNIMYSEHPFGHKQIFSTLEMQQMLDQAGFEVVHIKKIHELSFPNRYYLKKLLKNDLLVRLVDPMVTLFLNIFKVKNKMVVVARKKADD